MRLTHLETKIIGIHALAKLTKMFELHRWVAISDDDVFYKLLLRLVCSQVNFIQKFYSLQRVVKSKVVVSLFALNQAELKISGG